MKVRLVALDIDGTLLAPHLSGVRATGIDIISTTAFRAFSV
jgi:hydroxymethylpyrimidine pyrophosphatase-like HAD family hydrolase